MLTFIIGPFLVLVVLEVQLCNIINHGIVRKLFAYTLPHNVHPTPLLSHGFVNQFLIMFSINEWRFLQLFLYQVTDFWKAYETISRQLGLRLLKYTQTTGDISVIGTNGLTIPRSLRMVSILRWKCDDVYCVDIV